MIITLFESTTPALHSRRLVQFTLQGIWTKIILNLTAFESAHTFSHTRPFPTMSVLYTAHGTYVWLIPMTLLRTPHSSFDRRRPLPLIKDTHPLCISSSLVFLPSILGWILSAKISGVSVRHVDVNNIDLCQDLDLGDSQIRRFWSVEAMGITDTETAPYPTKDNATLSSFSD